MLANDSKKSWGEKYIFLTGSNAQEDAEQRKRVSGCIIVSFKLFIVTITFGLVIYTTLKVQKMNEEIDILKKEIQRMKVFASVLDDISGEDYYQAGEDTDITSEEFRVPIIIDTDFYSDEAYSAPQKLKNITDDEQEKPVTENISPEANSSQMITIVVKRGTNEDSNQDQNVHRSTRSNDEPLPNDENQEGDESTTRITFKRPRWRSNTYQEDVEEVETRRVNNLPRRRNRHRERINNLESMDDLTIRIRPQPTIHFSGDTSKYIFGKHENFIGNGHLRHPQKTYSDWKASDWARLLGMEEKFDLVNGFLKIKESGLYFIYTQIYYSDHHEINGYQVLKNREPILQCTVETIGSEKKSNTCYTAKVEYLREGDEISVQDIAEGRYSIFSPQSSFFGVIKLGDVKIK